MTAKALHNFFCPGCNSKLVTFYQRKPPAEPVFITYCPKYGDCPTGYTNGVGKGETFDDSIRDFHEKIAASKRKMTTTKPTQNEFGSITNESRAAGK